MSGMGQFRKSALVTVRSASPPTPDVVGKIGHVRKVPILLQKSVEIGGEPFRSADANLGEVDS